MVETNPNDRERQDKSEFTSVNRSTYLSLRAINLRLFVRPTNRLEDTSLSRVCPADDENAKRTRDCGHVVAGLLDGFSYNWSREYGKGGA